LGLHRFADRDLQALRRRAAGLPDRRPHQAGQSLACFASGRTLALGLGHRTPQEPGGLTRWYPEPRSYRRASSPPARCRSAASASRCGQRCAKPTNAGATDHGDARLPRPPHPVRMIPPLSVPWSLRSRRRTGGC